MDREDDWHVLIFESAGRLGTELKRAIRVGPDRDEALVRAAKLAAEHRPDHPRLARRRQVFRTAPDSWTVKVQGAAWSFHFAVCVANLVLDRPE
jgi:sarcosine oxidase gamma subunit